MLLRSHPWSVGWPALHPLTTAMGLASAPRLPIGGLPGLQRPMSPLLCPQDSLSNGLETCTSMGSCSGYPPGGAGHVGGGRRTPCEKCLQASWPQGRRDHAGNAEFHQCRSFRSAGRGVSPTLTAQCGWSAQRVPAPGALCWYGAPGQPPGKARRVQARANSPLSNSGSVRSVPEIPRAGGGGDHLQALPGRWPGGHAGPR